MSVLFTLSLASCGNESSPDAPESSATPETASDIASPAASDVLPPHQQLARDLLRELVEIDTTDSKGDNTRAAQAMADRLIAAGFSSDDVKVLEPAPRKGNLVARLRGRDSGRKPLLLLAHIDVVEADPDDWTLDPFTFTEQDGYYYGRGTTDDKDEAAIYIANLIRMKQEGFQPDRDIIVALTADEEGGNHNGVQWLLANHRELVDAEYALNEGGGGAMPDLRKFLQVCIPPEQAPDEPEIIEVGFKKGIPCSINGEKLSLCQVIERANASGARHGVGIVHLTEDRLVGLKVRGVYEAPGAEILIKAHFNLEKLVNTRDLNELKKFIDEKWAYTCYGAKWFDPSMDAIHAFQDSANQRVEGTVKVKLYKGKADVVAMESPYSLFDANLATFNKDASFNQNASAGFIEIYNLAQKTYLRFDQV
jgi:hypothetical protein